LEDKIKKIQKVTKENIVKASKKVKLNTVYLLRGGKKDEED
jgi:hypothetical protein